MSRLANRFHNHVPLRFVVHIFPGKGQRVAQGVGGRETDGIGPVGTDPVDDGGEHEVGCIGGDFGNVSHDGDAFAGESQAFEGGYFDPVVGGGGGDVLHEHGQELGPFFEGELDGGDFGAGLGGGVSGPLFGGPNGRNGGGFDRGALLGRQRLPSIVLLGLKGVVLGHEQVLELETGELTGIHVFAFGGELLFAIERDSVTTFD